jgi:hypothetical protein
MVPNLEAEKRTIYMIELHEDAEDTAQAPDYAAKLTQARLNEAKFVTFMVEEVFPVISKEVSRAGQIYALQLLKDTYSPPQVGGYTEVYLWMVYGVLDGGDADQYVTKIEDYGARVTRLRDFRQVAVWKNPSQE